MASDPKRTSGRRRRRDASEETAPHSAAAASDAAEAYEVEQRRLQMNLVHQKHRIQKVCADSSEWTTKELRETAKNLNLSNTSNMSKKGLCALLARHHDMLLTKEVEDETPEYPPGCFDMISHGPMYDPIIASDGYSYNRSSLRKMLVTAHREGKPCVSLINKSITLENPFPDIPNLPKAWPLIVNKSLKQWVEHWMQEHGLEITDEERKEHDRIPTPSRPDSLTPDEHGGIMQNGIYFIPSPDDVRLNTSPDAAAAGAAAAAAYESDDEKDDQTTQFVPTWLEDNLQHIVNTSRSEAPTMTYTKCAKQMGHFRLAFLNIEESAEMCLRRILNAYGCVVVNTLADKNVLLRHDCPVPIVVLDKHVHQILIFDTSNTNQWRRRLPDIASSIELIHSLVQRILACVWDRPSSIILSVDVYGNMFQHLSAMVEQLDLHNWQTRGTIAAYMQESAIGVWEGEQHVGHKFVPEQLDAYLSQIVAECRENGNFVASYSPEKNALLDRQQLRRPEETTEACLRRLLHAYGCVIIKETRAWHFLQRRLITVPVVVISAAVHSICVIDIHGTIHQIQAGAGNAFVAIGTLLNEILEMVWAPSNRQHAYARIRSDVFASIRTDLSSEMVKTEGARYNNSQICTILAQGEIGSI